MNKIIITCAIVVSSSLFSGCAVDNSTAADNTDYINYTVGFGGYDTYTPYYWNPGYYNSPAYRYTYWGNGYNSRWGSGRGYYHSGYGRGYAHGAGYGGHGMGGMGGHR